MSNFENQNQKSDQEQIKYKQKLKNYNELIQKRVALINTVGANKINEEERSLIKGYNDVTAYWDMQNDISDLRSKSYRSRDEDEQLGNLINNLERYKYSVLFHDILDHILNGQTTIEISDKTDRLAENIAGVDLFSSRLNIVDFNKKTNQIAIANWLLEINSVFLLLSDNSRKIVQEYKNQYENFQMTQEEFIKLMGSQDNIHILQEVAENFSRIQVLRGLISLVLQPYNLAYIKAIRNGQNLKNNKVLDGLEYFASNRIGELNLELQNNPDSFNSYQDFQSSYPDDNHGSYEQRLKDMRVDVYSEIQKIFDDPDFERLTRQKLEEQKKADSVSQ